VCVCVCVFVCAFLGCVCGGKSDAPLQTFSQSVSDWLWFYGFLAAEAFLPIAEQRGEAREDDEKMRIQQRACTVSFVQVLTA